MNRILIIISFLCILTLSACNQSRQEVYLLSQAERLMEWDTISAIISLSQIPEETFSNPYFFRIHNIHCIENVFYSKIIREIEKGNLENASKLVHQLIKTRNKYLIKDDELHSKDNDSTNLDTDLNTLKNLTLINSGASVPIDSLLFKTKNQIKHCLFGQVHTHGLEDTSSVELWIYKSKYYYYLLFCVIAILVLLIYSQHKSSEISHLHTKINKNEDEVKHLNHQVKVYKDQTNLRLGKGKQIFEALLDGGNMKNISIEDEQSFIDYYAFRYPQSYVELTSSYKSLSLRHTTYLILKKMGYEDKEIQRILFVQDSTIRNYRARIKKHIR